MDEENICGIYCIENTVNHKKYIGLSQDIDSRWKCHKRLLNNNTHINEHLQSSWNKYGEEHFSFTIIEECEFDVLKEKEIFYIQKFNSLDKKFGYNMTSGGDGVQDLRDESRDRISIGETLFPVIQLSLDGQIIKEHRNCRVAADTINGRTENIRNCCNNLYGYKSAYGYLWIYKKDYNETKTYSFIKNVGTKPVDRYDENGTYIDSFISAREAERITGISYKLISKNCYGGSRITKGYVWRFTGDSFDKYDTTLKQHTKKINQYDLNGNLINSFKSQNQVYKQLGFSVAAVVNKNKVFHGYIWESVI